MDGRIAFYSTRSGSYQVWMIRPDGSDLTQVTNLKQQAFFPAYSADGKKLATIASPVSMIADLSQIPATRAEVLPPIPSENFAFFTQSWSPNGKYLAGVPWLRRETVYIYSIADRTYRRVAEGGKALWLDDERLLIEYRGALSVVNVRSGAAREVLKTTLTVPLTVSGSREHLVFESQRTQSTVWIATIEKP